MPKIVKNGIIYVDKSENESKYVRGDTSTGAEVSGTFKIYSGTTDPSSSLGQNGDIYLKRVTS